MVENLQGFRQLIERLLVLTRQLVAKGMASPVPDLREEIAELHEILVRIGYDMDAAVREARAQFQKEFLPPREFFTVVCDQVEAALDHLRERNSVPDEIVDEVYDCVVKGDLARLMNEQSLLKVLLVAMGDRDRTAWQAEWFFQFVIGMNVYRLALEKGPIPVLEKAEEDVDGEKEEEEETAANGWKFGDPLPFGE